MDLSTLATPMFSNENPNDDFVFSPVTALFVHASDDDWKLKFGILIIAVCNCDAIH